MSWIVDIQVKRNISAFKIFNVKKDFKLFHFILCGLKKKPVKFYETSIFQKL